MNTEAFKNELRAEIQRCEALLSILEGAEEQVAATPTVAQRTNTSRSLTHRPRRRMSLATRKKISNSMKSNWTRVRSKSRHLSQSVKDKIAASQRKRWAEQKRAAASVTPIRSAA